MTGDRLDGAVKRLTDAGIQGARLDARVLWTFAQNVEASALIARDERRAITFFEQLIARRVAREPLAYIVGHKEFWSLEIAVGHGALIPRPDSETLIEELCKTFPDRQAPMAFVDLGTGSGCLLIAALKEFPGAHGVGVDTSSDALVWAKRNVARHGLENRATLIESGWPEEASPGFDVLLCNPPYVPAAHIAALEPEVRLYEPRAALDGGLDGLDAYRTLAPRIGRLLKPGGRAFVEIGAGQSGSVCDILKARHLKVAAITQDLAGIPRCLVLIRDNQDE